MLTQNLCFQESISGIEAPSESIRRIECRKHGCILGLSRMNGSAAGDWLEQAEAKLSGLSLRCRYSEVIAHVILRLFTFQGNTIFSWIPPCHSWPFHRVH
jgi:hypothetical protein